METIKKLFKNKSFISMGVVAVLIFLAWSNREKLKKMLGMGEKPLTAAELAAKAAADAAAAKAGTNTATGGGTSTPTGLQYDKIVEMGSQGEEVREVQKILNAELSVRKATPISSDFALNSIITDAKNDVALVVDGKAGDKTIALLEKYAGVKMSSINQLKANSKMLTSPSSPYSATNQAIKDATNRALGTFSPFSK